MKISELKEIENKYNFEYPGLYKKLSEDNMLDWGDVCYGWVEKEYPKLKDKPPLLLYHWEFEIISSREDVINVIDFYSDEDCYFEIKEEYYYKFIPFGSTEGGDFFCFFLDEDNKIKYVVLLLHDDDNVEILANTFQEFIFRYLLESVVELDEDMLIMKGGLKDNCDNLLKSHSEYLTSNQISIVQDIFNRSAIPKLNQKELSLILKDNGLDFSNIKINCYKD